MGEKKQMSRSFESKFRNKCSKDAEMEQEIFAYSNLTMLNLNRLFSELEKEKATLEREIEERKKDDNKCVLMYSKIVKTYAEGGLELIQNSLRKLDTPTKLSQEVMEFVSPSNRIFHADNDECDESFEGSKNQTLSKEGDELALDPIFLSNAESSFSPDDSLLTECGSIYPTLINPKESYFGTTKENKSHRKGMSTSNELTKETKSYHSVIVIEKIDGGQDAPMEMRPKAKKECWKDQLKSESTNRVNKGDVNKEQEISDMYTKNLNTIRKEQKLHFKKIIDCLENGNVENAEKQNMSKISEILRQYNTYFYPKNNQNVNGCLKDLAHINQSKTSSQNYLDIACGNKSNYINKNQYSTNKNDSDVFQDDGIDVTRYTSDVAYEKQIFTKTNHSNAHLKTQPEPLKNNISNEDSENQHEKEASLSLVDTSNIVLPIDLEEITTFNSDEKKCLLSFKSAQLAININSDYKILKQLSHTNENVNINLFQSAAKYSSQSVSHSVQIESRTKHMIKVIQKFDETSSSRFHSELNDLLDTTKKNLIKAQKNLDKAKGKIDLEKTKATKKEFEKAMKEYEKAKRGHEKVNEDSCRKFQERYDKLKRLYIDCFYLGKIVSSRNDKFLEHSKKCENLWNNVFPQEKNESKVPSYIMKETMLLQQKFYFVTSDFGVLIELYLYLKMQDKIVEK